MAKEKCWNCGCPVMTPDKRGLVCDQCGATTTELPTPSALGMTVQSSVKKDGYTRGVPRKQRAKKEAE